MQKKIYWFNAIYVENTMYLSREMKIIGKKLHFQYKSKYNYKY